VPHTDGVPDCLLCRPLQGPRLPRRAAEPGSWQLWLNRNQNLLRKYLLVLGRHEERVDRLTPQEWADLQACLADVTDGPRRVVAPDHFNHAFLRNQDRHVHQHVMPRDAAPRVVAGVVFADPDYPAHYRVPGPGCSAGRRLGSALAHSSSGTRQIGGSRSCPASAFMPTSGRAYRRSTRLPDR
jgi:diadenosine tetraphosphate (Ap4A) HIT family hydrolase